MMQPKEKRPTAECILLNIQQIVKRPKTKLNTTHKILTPKTSSDKNSFLGKRKKSAKKDDRTLEFILKNLIRNLKTPEERIQTERKHSKVSKHKSLETSRVKVEVKSIPTAYTIIMNLPQRQSATPTFPL